MTGDASERERGARGPALVDDAGPGVGTSDDVHAAIRDATYRALCAHGYTDATIQDIADEFEKSKSLLYYHYDDKDELLTDFLEHLLEALADEMAITGDDPYDDLQTLIDRLVPVPMDAGDRRLRRVLLEVRAGAAHDPAHRDLVARSDDIIRSAFADVVRRGVESGRFAAVDPEETAAFLHASLLGVMTRGVPLDDPGAVREARAAVEAHLEARLRPGESG